MVDVASGPTRGGLILSLAKEHCEFFGLPILVLGVLESAHKIFEERGLRASSEARSEIQNTVGLELQNFLVNRCTQRMREIYSQFLSGQTLQQLRGIRELHSVVLQSLSSLSVETMSYPERVNVEIHNALAHHLDFSDEDMEKLDTYIRFYQIFRSSIMPNGDRVLYDLQYSGPRLTQSNLVYRKIEAIVTNNTQTSFPGGRTDF